MIKTPAGVSFLTESRLRKFASCEGTVRQELCINCLMLRMYDMNKLHVAVNNIQRLEAGIRRGIPTFQMLN